MATSMGTSRNGRCEAIAADEEGTTVTLLQWGPPGMGGVRTRRPSPPPIPAQTSMGTSRNGRCEGGRTARMPCPSHSVLQWGPPGMGGVSRHHRAHRGIRDRGTSMGTSRNGRCESEPYMPVNDVISHFNGDLPEWEV